MGDNLPIRCSGRDHSVAVDYLLEDREERRRVNSGYNSCYRVSSVINKIPFLFADCYKNVPLDDLT